MTVDIKKHEMLAQVIENRMTIPVIIEWSFHWKWALSMTNDFSQFISD